VETTRVSSKGQVVIPKSIRDRLHLEAGATLSVGVENDAIVLHQVRKALRLPTESEIDAVAGCLKVGGPVRLSRLYSERNGADDFGGHQYCRDVSNGAR